MTELGVVFLKWAKFVQVNPQISIIALKKYPNFGTARNLMEE